MPIFKMAKIVTRNLFSKPATVLYPVVKKGVYANTRGSIGIEIEKCIYCGICSRRCPTGAIAVDKNEKTWTIEPFNCINCNYCVEVCPKKCLTMDNAYTTPATQKVKEVAQGARVSDNTENN